MPPPDTPADLVAALAAGEPEMREKPLRALDAHGVAALHAVRQGIAGARSAEAHTRLARMLSALLGRAPTPETLRTLRAVSVLERAGTRPAWDALKHLVAASPGALLGRQAALAMRRLEYRLAGP